MFSLEDHYWWFIGRRTVALNLLRAYLPYQSERAKILDVGCGTGVVLRELSQWSSPIGLDMSTLALGYCQTRKIRSIVQGDGIAMPIASQTLDAIIGLDIFEHIEDDVKAFEESFRVLKPKGVLVLSVPAFMSLWGPHDVALMHMRRYRKGNLIRKLADAGFEIERAGYSVFFLFPIVVVWRLFEKFKTGPAKASLVKIPSWLNRFLILIQSFESGLIRRFDLPWGSSVLVVARKPGRDLLP